MMIELRIQVGASGLDTFVLKPGGDMRMLEQDYWQKCYLQVKMISVLSKQTKDDSQEGFSETLLI